MVYKVLVVDPVHPDLASFLEERFSVSFQYPISQRDFSEAIGEFDILVLRSGVQVNEDILSKATCLKHIIRAGTGTDNIDLENVKKRGISFYNTPSTNARAVAELAIGLAHGLYRHTFRANTELRNGIWNKKGSLGYQLSNKHVGLIGFGSIGQEVSQLAKGYNMQISCVVHHYSEARKKALSEQGIQLFNHLELLVQECDILIVCCPLTSDTHNIFNQKLFNLMRSETIIINVARGGVISENDLYQALIENKIYGAASDVFEKEREFTPLFELNNFIGTPHIGAMTHESQQKIASLIIDYICENLI